MHVGNICEIFNSWINVDNLDVWETNNIVKIEQNVVPRYGSIVYSSLKLSNKYDWHSHKAVTEQIWDIS